MKDNKIMNKWNEEMDYFCSRINFAKSLMNPKVIQFMNRGFDIEDVFEEGRTIGRQEVEKEHMLNNKLLKEKNETKNNQ